MRLPTLGAILIVVFGLAGVWFYRGTLQSAMKDAEVAQSDSKITTRVRIGGDGYLGYFFMRSLEMKRNAARRGIGIDFTDDGGDYAARLEKFNKGEYDAIVLPVNSYIMHGRNVNYPGVIVSAIAESKGADAMACFTGAGTKLPADPKVQDLNNASLRIAYTPESPSSFLLDLAMADFDLFNLKSGTQWRVTKDPKDPTKDLSSERVLEMARQKQADCFVMWEPEVTRSLNGSIPGLQKVWGSDKFGGYIVDVFVFRRKFLDSNYGDVVAFFESYFQSMQAYRADRNRMVADIKSMYNLPSNEVESVLKEIHWYDISENARRQFGIKGGVADGDTAEGVVNTINASTDVLMRTGQMSKDPLGGDMYKIVTSSVLKKVRDNLPKQAGMTQVKRQFTPLSDQEWKGLREIGVMRVEPITFQSSSGKLSPAGEAQVDKIAELIVNNYPDARIVVRGHTGRGDEQANLELSEDRAEAVTQRLIAVFGVDQNRVRAEGMGSAQPPAKRPDENQRTFMYRWPRVEFTVYEDASNF